MHDMKGRAMNMEPLVSESVQKMQDHYNQALAAHITTSGKIFS